MTRLTPPLLLLALALAARCWCCHGSLSSYHHEQQQYEKINASSSSPQQVRESRVGLNVNAAALVVFLDIYRVLDDLVEHGGKYGLSETARGCCGTGTVEVTALCDSRFVSVCDDVSHHVFFDAFHPTERAYRIIVKDIFDNYGRQLLS